MEFEIEDDWDPKPTPNEESILKKVHTDFSSKNFSKFI